MHVRMLFPVQANNGCNKLRSISCSSDLPFSEFRLKQYKDMTSILTKTLIKIGPGTEVKNHPPPGFLRNPGSTSPETG